MSGRIRSLKPEWLEDELLALSSVEARLLSVALILLADDYGNGRASSVLLAGRVFPGKSPEFVEKFLEELATIRYLSLYEVDGQRYFSIRNWSKHQRVDKPGKNRVPFPPQPSDRNDSVRITPGNVRETLENDSEKEKKLPASRDPDPDPISLPDPISDQPVRLDQAPQVQPQSAQPTAALPPLPAVPKPNAFDDSFTGNTPERRADVAQVHQVFRQTIGKPHLKFRAPFDVGAKAIATAIDSDGLDACLAVARHCMFDGMVNGKLDDKRQKHDSAEYVFGNVNAFHRILDAAIKAGKGNEPKKRLSASEAVAAAKALPVNR